MPPIPVGVGSDYIRVAAEVERSCESLSGLYLLEPKTISIVIRHIHRTTDMTLPDIIANGGCHQLHILLWQVREGEVSFGKLE